MGLHGGYAMSKQSYKAWYAVNKEKRLAYNREWREKNREKVRATKRAIYHRNPEKSLARNKKWVKKNKNKIKEYQKKYHAEHRKEHNEAMRRWRKENPEKVAAQEKRRYRRKSRREKLQWLKEKEYTPVVHLNAADRAFADLGVRYD